LFFTCPPPPPPRRRRRCKQGLYSHMYRRPSTYVKGLHSDSSRLLPKVRNQALITLPHTPSRKNKAKLILPHGRTSQGLLSQAENPDEVQQQREPSTRRLSRSHGPRPEPNHTKRKGSNPVVWNRSKSQKAHRKVFPLTSTPQLERSFN